MSGHIGILTSCGDCPGLNAAIRGIGKAAHERFGIKTTGFLNGFRGLALDHTIDINDGLLSGILSARAYEDGAALRETTTTLTDWAGRATATGRLGVMDCIRARVSNRSRRLRGARPLSAYPSSSSWRN